MIVPITEDLYNYENKVWGNFTKRQLICIGISFAIIVPIFLLLFWSTGSIDLSALAAAFAATPVMMCAVWKKDGQHLEQVVWYKFRARFKFPQKRKHVTTNLYEDIMTNQKEFDKYYDTLNGSTDEESQKNKGAPKIINALAKKKQHTR